MATWNTDGSLTDVKAKVVLASSGDTVVIPTGSFTWGAGSDSLNLNKAITLEGAGPTTIITVSSGTSSSGLIQVNAAATIKNFAIIPSAGKTNFNINVSGWRITGITYNSAAASVVAYFALINLGYGVIDNCDITGGGGNNELIFGQGPDDAWDTAYVPGTANAVYIENCTFNGPGYVCDANSNASFVVRYNTIRGEMKIDGHGINTNQSPVRGCRAMEIYGNVWTATSGSNWAAVEVRGGVGFIWGNYISGTNVLRGYYRLTDYAVNAPGSQSFGGVFQTPYNWPIPDQIGAGPGATGAQSGGGQPLYFFNNIKGTSLGTLRFDTVDDSSRYTFQGGYLAGVSRVEISGGTANVGNYIRFSGDVTNYQIVATTYSGSSGTITINPTLQADLPAARISGLYGARANYQGQTSDNSANFTFGPNSPCIIQNGRDYYQTVEGFDGSSGVGSGTVAQMLAITPSQSGVTFWASNTGSWNTTAAPDTGVMFKWDGDSWEVFYTPYQYPFYASSGSPGVTYVFRRLGSHPKFKCLVPA